MKVYIAAPKQLFHNAQALAFLLMVDQHEVVSSWLFSFALRNENNMSASDKAGLATVCLAELDTADLIVLLLPEPNQPIQHTGGAFVEFGYGLQTNAICCCVGPQHNIFESLPRVKAFRYTEELFEFLEERGGDEP